MGGNAFDNTVRISKSEYDRIKFMLLPLFSQCGFQVACLVEISDKETFGDIDFICATVDKSEFLREQLLSTIFNALESTEPLIRNKHFVHFLSKERYQIDINFVDMEDFHIHAAVLGNGDFSWLLQMSLAKYNLLLSCYGLFIILSSVFSEISKAEATFLLSKDPNQIRGFLGLPNHALDGITSLSQEEIFTIISTNKFFSYDAFHTVSNSQLRSIKKKRGMRPLIKSFYNWLHDTFPNNSNTITTIVNNTTNPTDSINNRNHLLNISSINNSSDNQLQLEPDLSDDSNSSQDISGNSSSQITPIVIATVRQEALQYFNKQDEFRTYVEAIQLQLEDNRYRQLSKSFINGTIIAHLLPQLSGPQIGEVLTAVKQKYGGPTWKSFHDWLAVTSQDDIHNCIIEMNQNRN